MRGTHICLALTFNRVELRGSLMAQKSQKPKPEEIHRNSNILFKENYPFLTYYLLINALLSIHANASQVRTSKGAPYLHFCRP